MDGLDYGELQLSTRRRIDKQFPPRYQFGAISNHVCHLSSRSTIIYTTCSVYYQLLPILKPGQKIALSKDLIDISDEDFLSLLDSSGLKPWSHSFAVSALSLGATPLRIQMELEEQVQTGEELAIYDRLAALFFLPPHGTPGVCRNYLSMVETARCFKLTKEEYQRYENFLPEDSFQVGPLFLPYRHLQILERLLAEMGLPGLGFPIGIVPNSYWLLRVGRIIDYKNLSEAYLMSIPRYLSTGYGPAASEHLIECQKSARSDIIRRIGVNKPLRDNVKSLKKQTEDIKVSEENALQLQKEVDRINNSIEQQKEALNTSLFACVAIMKILSDPAVSEQFSQHENIMTFTDKNYLREL